MQVDVHKMEDNKERHNLNNPRPKRSMKLLFLAKKTSKVLEVKQVMLDAVMLGNQGKCYWLCEWLSTTDRHAMQKTSNDAQGIVVCRIRMKSLELFWDPSCAITYLECLLGDSHASHSTHEQGTDNSTCSRAHRRTF
jgi:hypothetical protein